MRMIRSIQRCAEILKSLGVYLVTCQLDELEELASKREHVIHSSVFVRIFQYILAYIQNIFQNLRINK